MSLTTEQKVRIFFSAVALVVIIIGLVLNYNAWLSAKDILIINEIKALASGLEHYHTDFWRYPTAENITLGGQLLLTDNGFSTGRQIYYQGSILTDAKAHYVSDGERYQITFRLKNNWSQVGLGGKNCLLTSGLVLACSKK